MQDSAVKVEIWCGGGVFATIKIKEIWSSSGLPLLNECRGNTAGGVFGMTGVSDYMIWACRSLKNLPCGSAMDPFQALGQHYSRHTRTRKNISARKWPDTHSCQWIKKWGQWGLGFISITVPITVLILKNVTCAVFSHYINLTTKRSLCVSHQHLWGAKLFFQPHTLSC